MNPNSESSRIIRKVRTRAERRAFLQEGWVIANHILVSFHVAFISSVLALGSESLFKAAVLQFIFVSPETLVSAVFMYISFHTAIAIHEIGHFLSAARLNALNPAVLEEVRPRLEKPGLGRMVFYAGLFLRAPYGKARGIKREGLNFYPDAPYNLAVAAAGPRASRNLAFIALPPAVLLLAVGLAFGNDPAVYVGRLLLGIGVVALLDFLMADPGKYKEFNEREKTAEKKAASVESLSGWLEKAPTVMRKMLAGRIQEVTHPRLGPVTAPWQFRNCGMGGRHTEKEYPESNISMQEAMFLILGARDYQEGQEMTVRLQTRLKEIIEKEEGCRVMGIGLEGGLAPFIEKGDYPMPEVRLWDMMKQTIEECGFTPGVDVAIALDPALSELEIAYRKEFNMPDSVGMYLFWRDKAKKVLDRDSVLEIYQTAIRDYEIPILSVEDGFSEDDHEGWKKILDALGDRIFVIGDDLVTTNDRTIEIAAAGGMMNSALIKANQIGSLYETLLAMLVALGKGQELVVSHRSKSPNDDMEAHIALAANALGLKAGGGANTERLVKYQSVAELMGKGAEDETPHALHEDQKAIIQKIFAYEESTNAGVPTVGVTVDFLLPESGVVLKFRGATPLGTSAGTGEAIHLVDALIEAAEHREVIERNAAFFTEKEPGVFAFKKDAGEDRIKEKGDEALSALFARAQRYQGKGCLNAVENVLEIIAPAFEGRNAATLTLKDIDHSLLDLEMRVAKRRGKLSDGASSEELVHVMQRKQNLGMNAMLSVSLALARGVAHMKGKELFELLREEMLSIISSLTESVGVDIPGSRFSDYVTALREANKILEAEDKPLYESLRKITGVYTGKAEAVVVEAPAEKQAVSPPMFPPEPGPVESRPPAACAEVLEAILSKLGPAFEDNVHHGLCHVRDLLDRAALLAGRLGVENRIDWRILTAAICFHDVASESESHGEEGAARARKVLAEVEAVPAGDIGRVEEAIRLHEDRTEEGAAARKAAGLEAQLLYDVDQLEAFGVKGIYRYVAVYTDRGTALEKILPNAEARFRSLTFEESRALAADDYAFTRSFFEKRLLESHGEDSLLGARGVSEWIRRHHGSHPAKISKEALEALANEEDGEDLRYSHAFFTALETAYEEAAPAGEPTPVEEEAPAFSPGGPAESFTEEEQQEIYALNQALFKALELEDNAAERTVALRLYLKKRGEAVLSSGRYGFVNNCIYRSAGWLILPYLVGNTVIIHGVSEGKTETLASKQFPPGTIFTHRLLESMAGFTGEPMDLEKEIFDFDVDAAEPIRISRIRDMAAELKKINESTNRNQVVHALRCMVAKLNSLSFKAFLGAKNMQPEVANLLKELVRFLNNPFSRRVPLLARNLVRNIAGLVVKPHLIDRLWNDTIDLAEVHIRGSDIVNELRRSTHHALGKRTLQLATAYLEFLESGAVKALAGLGYSTPGAADVEAKNRKTPVEIVRRIVEDLEKFLGASEIVERIRDWQEDYRTALTQCDFGKSLSNEVEEVVNNGIREKNRWTYLHHLRILKKKVVDFSRFSDIGDDCNRQLDELLDLKPDDPGFDTEGAERTVTESLEAFTARIRTAYQDDLFASLDEVVEAYGSGDFQGTFTRIHDLRNTLVSTIRSGGFSEQRHLLYQLDCLLEEMGFLALRHVSSIYETGGVNVEESLHLIRTCILNLKNDGIFSRELTDFASMLGSGSRTYAEALNLLDSIQRTYHKILQRVTAPFETLRERLDLEEDELQTVLGALQRGLYDLNSMVNFCELARAHVRDTVQDLSSRIDGGADDAEAGDKAFDILHLSHRDEIGKRLTDEDDNLRERYGGKGSGLLYISHLELPSRDGFILPTTLPKSGLHKSDRPRLVREITDHLRILEDGGDKRFGDTERPMLLAVRGGSVFSMPGILSTVVFVGMNDAIAKALAGDDPWNAYDSYRRFLASYAQTVWGVDLEAFDLVEETKRRYGVKAKDDLPWEGMKEVVESSKTILRQKGFGEALDKVLGDPLEQVFTAVEAVFDSWDGDTARRYRDIMGLCDSWHTAAIIQEMAFGNRTNEAVVPGLDEVLASLTGAIPHTSMTDRGVRTLLGEIKFSAAGDDLVGGVTASGSFLSMEELRDLMPMLERRLKHVVARLRRFQGTDQEIEFTVERGVLSVLQSRTAEKGMDQDLVTFEGPGTEDAFGIGIRGGAFRGVAAFDEEDLKELSTQNPGDRDDADGILLVMENPTPGDIPLILSADGLLTAKGGHSSHAAVAINGLESRSNAAVMSAVGLRVSAKKHEAVLVDEQGKERHQIRKGDVVSLHGTTGEVYLGSRMLRGK